MVSLNLLALAAVAAALEVTSPSSNSVWTVGDSQTVTWDSVSTDQSSFNIYLSNMVNYPSTTVLLASDVSTSAGSATIDGSKLTAGDSFTINFTNGTNTEQLYAQSNQFNFYYHHHQRHLHSYHDHDRHCHQRHCYWHFDWRLQHCDLDLDFWRWKGCGWLGRSYKQRDARRNTG
ncbi:Ser-Thr-rich glycosyl-phosphatidyl-inositol-anchored membrane family-domain-containing protein [Coniella lustricola]|uniref:Ser-Thr-rich glycosyl-phosphatidyl-inositol-anchored membrane family-domain-containing protein n=1 Tax=Coniella lustricola TaxID=2025994 RepID=A0A2T3AGJ2_9PEZI|nr:Ser-Thr-rich glycosyl-phosphatidyl-inositol-anchored membrane family-domain-containing protein [Coniella lustricola]